MWGVLIDGFDTKEEAQDLAKNIQNILDIKFSSPNKFKIRLVGSKRRNNDSTTK